MDTKELLLPQIESKGTVSLSPFTWTNIKLPPFLPIKQKAKSVSEKKALKSEKQSQGLHLKTIKEQPKEHMEGEDKRLKRKKQEAKTQKIIDRPETHTAITEVKEPHLENQRYRLRSKVQRLNKTIELVRNEQKNQQQKPQPKRIRFLDDKNNMQKYLKNNLARIGWSSNNKSPKNQVSLIWSNIDKTSDHYNIKEGQFYNHLNGSFHLTNKDKLHQVVSGKNYYSKSFAIPQQYQQFAKENNRIAIKRMLKVIAKEINAFVNEGDPQSQLMQVHLGQILQSSILMMANQQTTMLVKLCMYLQEVRRQQKYNSYFQHFEGYRHVSLHPKQHFYDTLIQKSFAYLQGSQLQYLTFSFKDIDYRVLILILHYHKIFSQFDQTYTQDASLWIIKPIASSRGAGISLVKAGRQFCINPDSLWSEHKNRKKYENKIIQKYVSNPYILQKPQQFSGRKFDIRQWVLVSSHKGKPIIYKYHTAYCRFSHERYNTNKLNKQIHLTNYSIFKNSVQTTQVPSIMMLQDLFSAALGDLRNKFNQQINYIITDTILSCSHIRYQQGCFELFGYDFLLDDREKVYLLQVNLNPACNAQRHQVLKQQSQTMTKTMISLITESKPTDKWIKLYGASSTLQSQSETDQLRSNSRGEEMTIKPYYQYQISEDESLIAYIRHKNRVIGKMIDISQKFLYQTIMKKLQLKKQQEKVQQQNIDLAALIHFVEEKSVSNL